MIKNDQILFLLVSWGLSVGCLVRVWKVSGGCLEGVWGFEEGVCGVSVRCLEGVWGCLRDVWRLS